MSPAVPLTPTQPSQLEKQQEFQLANDKALAVLPVPFPFPANYPPIVESALLGRVVPPEAMKRFLSCIARAVYAIKCYPTSQEYESVGMQVIQKYPFMKSPAGSPYVSFVYTSYFKYYYNYTGLVSSHFEESLL